MMNTLIKGQRLALSNISPSGQVQIGISSHGLALDFACFGLDAQGKLSDDRYMTFFNQPNSPCGGVELCHTTGDALGFAFRLNQLPSHIERLVITASVDGSGTLAQLTSGYLRLLANSSEAARFSFSGADFAAERAVMLAELYRKNGEWRLMAVSQGFNGGLDRLVEHFGGSVAEEPAKPAPTAPKPPPPAPALAKRISLEKRIASEAPQLVNLVKQAGVSLTKVGLNEHRARVCLVLDISGSMHSLYKKGLVQAFSERILALGCQFDDDGEIDVFLFGEQVHQPEPMSLSNCHDYVQQAINQHPLEGNTRYGLAMQAVRRYYFPDGGGNQRSTPMKAELPVYVMFVTDGTTSDIPLTEKQLRWSSYEPIFWQFMGIGKGKKSKNKLLAMFDSDFAFLEKLDELDGRFIDNADFFATASPDEHSDTELYDLLMTEYPAWLKLAKQRALL